jgi:RimJ/RimL family protein N-acetyltransferase
MTAAFGIETERLQMRWLTLDDADLMLAVWNDPAFVRNVGDRGIRTEQQARDAMQKGVLNLYESYGYGPYRVALKDDDTPIGIIGMFRREGLSVPDIGYALLPDYCGKGYAFEASRAVINYARDELALERMYAIISPGNTASIGLSKKLGLEFDRMHRMPGDDDEICLYGIRFDGQGQ